MRLLLLILLCGAVPAARAAKPLSGTPAPAIEATLLDGTAFSLGKEAGKVVIVHFWATWCAACRMEMPLLDAFYKAHRNEGVVVVGISLDDPQNLAEARSVMAAFSFPSAMLTQTQAAGYGRLWRIPLTFVIDRHGILRRDAWTAAPKVDAAVLDNEVLPLLDEPQAP